ncbi:uncharacterized protein [Epargyreus clarus]|uniref:uncharacterized protein isoform X2 n=1 Tax=Epargyreus clarus TaxID=520877 RepID=UPI003C2F97AF
MFDHLANPPPAQTTPPPKKVLKFDKGYVKTLPGILKVTQLLCNIIGFICIKVSWAWLSAIFFNTIYWFGNIITLFLFIMYMFHFVEKYDRCPWRKYEFFYCAFMCLAYISTSTYALIIGGRGYTAGGRGYTAGFFGLCALIAYGIDGYMKYNGWKQGLPAQ